MRMKIRLILTASMFLLLLTAVNPTLGQPTAGHLPLGIEIPERRTAPPIVAATRTATTQIPIATGTGRLRSRARLLTFISIAVVMSFTSPVSAQHFGDWGAPVNAESILGISSELNTISNEGRSRKTSAARSTVRSVSRALRTLRTKLDAPSSTLKQPCRQSGHLL